MLNEFRTYDEARAGFRWQVPPRYNIAHAACDAFAAKEPDRTALFVCNEAGEPAPITYGALQSAANRLAHVLLAQGIGRGDRVAVQLGQSIETVLAHLAIYKLGAVAVPIAAVFGPDAVAYRITTAGARLILTTVAGAERLAPAHSVPALAVDGSTPTGPKLSELMARASDHFQTADTGPDDPALMIFTSGTTGQPKGALHGHRVLIGHLPGVAMHHDLMPHPGDRLWTPADWAWAGGLLNVLLPGLALGVPVVAQRSDRFEPEEALDWAAIAGVRNAFIPPTALRMMRALTPKLRLRSVGSGGEQLGAATFEWGRRALGLTINEFYGQTECNLVLSSCAAWQIASPGVIGRAVPGHSVAIVDEEGVPLPDGDQGTIAIKAPDPVMFLSYWNQEAATREKFKNGHMLTGDQGIAGEHGITFVGRDDDVITSSGYRIGPGEIEDCLVGHPAVALAAVVGEPDALRGEIVSAFIKLRPGTAPGDALADAIQTHVRERLSAHEYPRRITFVDEIPLTTTGKVIRRAFRQS